MTNKFYKLFLMLLYMLTITTSINSSGVTNFYILMELMMLMFLYMSTLDKKKINLFSSSEKTYYYLSTQTMASISMMMIMMLKDSMMMSNMNISWLSMVFIIFKLGMYPMSFWMYKLSYMNNETFFVMMVLQKIPLLMLLELTNNFYFTLMLVLNMIIGSINLTMSKNFKEMLVSSSLYSMFWVYIFISVNMMFFFMYYSMFFFTTYFLMYYKMMNMSIKILYMFSVSLPPLGPFFLKLETMMNLLEINTSMKMIIFFCILMSLFSYTFYFFNYMMKKFLLYNLKNNNFKLMYLMTISMIMMI